MLVRGEHIPLLIALRMSLQHRFCHSSTNAIRYDSARADITQMSEPARVYDPANVYRESASTMQPVGSPIFPFPDRRICRIPCNVTDSRDRCKTLFNHPQPKPSSSSSFAPRGQTSTNTGGSTRMGRTTGRKIGSDENPIDMAYYDVLGLKAGCTADEVKKAYRRLAIKVSRHYTSWIKL